MKKLLLLMTWLLTTATAVFAQSNEVEKKLNIRDVALTAVQSTPLSEPLCACRGNILKDGGFTAVTAPGSNISASSTPWTTGDLTPQWSPAAGCCNKGYVAMWGNKTVGESVRQNGISMIAGKKYHVEFCARFVNQTGPLNAFVRFRFKALPANIVISPATLNISNTSWATYSFDWTATANCNAIDIGPENNNIQNNGAYVSWGNLDNVCITEKTCECDIFSSHPVITGPAVIKCDSIARFTTNTCPDATITWSVSPAVSFTGQGTTTITLNPPFSATAYTISVTLTCGDKKVSSSRIVKVMSPNCCAPDFMISTQEVSANGYRITGIPSVPTSGCQHYWLLSQISNCGGNGTVGTSGWGLSYNAWGYALPQPNPAITTAGPNLNGYTYPGLGKGQCYVLTHYVLCCGQWKFMKKCFCMNNQARMNMQQKELNATEQSGTIEYQDLPEAVKSMHSK